MADWITIFFGSSTISGLFIILLVNLIVIGAIMGKKKFIPTKVFLMNILLWSGIFVDAGILPNIYALFLIVGAAGMITYLYGEQFSVGGGAVETGIIVRYVVFFSVCILLETMILSTSTIFGSPIGFQVIPVCHAEEGGSSTTIWIPIISDVIGSGINIPVIGDIINLGKCAGSWFGQLYTFFDLRTALGIFNTILIIPFIVVMAIFMIRTLFSVFG